MSDSESDNDAPVNQCSICLESLYDATLLDPCFHRFCFACTLAWLRVTPSCPLCKQACVAVIHRIVSPHDFERLLLDDALRRERSAGKRRRDDATAPQPVPLPPVSVRREVYERRLKVLPLQFERAEERASVADALERVRRLDHVAQDLAKHWHRIEPFAERDLRALTGLRDVALLKRALVSLITVHNVRRSDDAQRYLRQFLPAPEHADQFFVELVAFAASVFSVATYDRVVQYDPPLSRPELPPPVASSATPAVVVEDVAPLAVPGASSFCTCDDVADDDGEDVCGACREVAFLKAKVAAVDAELRDNAERLRELEDKKNART